MKCPECSKELPDNSYRSDHSWFTTWSVRGKAGFVHRHNYRKPPKLIEPTESPSTTLAAKRLLASLGIDEPTVLMEMRAEAAVKGDRGALEHFALYEVPAQRMSITCDNCDEGAHDRMEARQLRDESQRLLNEACSLLNGQVPSQTADADVPLAVKRISPVGQGIPGTYSWRERFAEREQKLRRQPKRFSRQAPGFRGFNG